MRYEIAWQKGTGPKWKLPLSQPSDAMAQKIISAYASAGHIPVGAQVELWSDVGQMSERLAGWWEVLPASPTLVSLQGRASCKTKT